jgi:alkanesulfonate monooxygenase SsuD/methylene tetrahydromethanopterin reductase-like flavin-dependent oxidoreductase (luciferase family)
MIKLGYGLITCQTHPDDPRDWQALYSEALELAVMAESAGAESIWVSEHHFTDDGYLPALLPLMSALSAVTTTASIGSAMVLAPLYDPVRLAEDAAVTDLISRGRVILGLGLGWREEEFTALDKSTKSRGRALETAINVCRAGWQGEPTKTSPDGSRYGYIVPQPASGRIPIWIGAGADVGLRRAGRLADGFMATNCTPDEFATSVRTVREEAERHGRNPDDIEIAVHLQTFVTDDPDPWSVASDPILYQTWKYVDIAPKFGFNGVLQHRPKQDSHVESWVRSVSVVGDADRVAERIHEYADRVGGNLHFVARSYFPGLGAQRQRENVQALAEIRRSLQS